MIYLWIETKLVEFRPIKACQCFMSQLQSRGIDSEIAKWIKRIHLKWNSETKTRFDEYMTLIPEAIGLWLAASHKIF